MDKTTETPTTEGRVSRLVMPFGMKVIPLGWPVMAQAFMDFAMFTVKEDSFVDAFQDDTDISLANLIPRNPLDAMIDKATGHGREVFAQYLDGLAVNHWGVEEA